MPTNERAVIHEQHAQLPARRALQRLQQVTGLKGQRQAPRKSLALHACAVFRHEAQVQRALDHEAFIPRAGERFVRRAVFDDGREEHDVRRAFRLLIQRVQARRDAERVPRGLYRARHEIPQQAGRCHETDVHVSILPELVSGQTRMGKVNSQIFPKFSACAPSFSRAATVAALRAG